MITNKITLILGAGASKHLGYPIGYELKRDIIQWIDENINNSNEKYFEAGFEEKELKEFSIALSRSGRTSIDSFLEYRKEFYSIGRFAIAHMIFRYEDILYLFKASENWYEYLFQRMSSNVDRFIENKISILTFNYDRSLEAYLFNALLNSYGISETKASNVMKYIPIVHLHGKLGNLPYLGEDEIPYGEQKTIKQMLYASKQISLVHDIDSNNDGFKKINSIIKESENIVFLGFGYDSRNISKLNLDFSINGPSYFGTAFGYTQKEIFDIHQSFLPRGLNFGESDMSIIKYLRSNIKI